ncbi:hypothetical protein [Natrialbaceae archaeon AArc-T1-2]|uniref:hypothetical protein n=1 Tax=Natrialbaceae archaeon AArc-T1-2 TaxID=3053904 RepID=UPI00255ACF09|nr:hypothetical protein [Natrialbaceae archaeon AArc-T1-2]WIV67065.1 hypothetical protein QQ977_15475 [Natrialbaceae archaeon AArc-T1-2]
MSDDEERADNEDTATDTDDGSDPMSPGGGPRRVVSDQGVDDILESISSMPDGDETTPADGEDGGVRIEDEPADDDDPSAESPPADLESAADDLATRVERGDVTGADVRSAEAGADREPTPEVDELDLSLEDLEAGPDSADVAAEPEPADGPLAKSGEEGTTATATREPNSDDDGADGADDGGILARIRRLFSP